MSRDERHHSRHPRPRCDPRRPAWSRKRSVRRRSTVLRSSSSAKRAANRCKARSQSPVVYQRGEPCDVMNAPGQFHGVRDWLVPRDPEAIDARAWRIALAASWIAQERLWPTECAGATHFYAHEKVTPEWAGKPCVIAGHTFTIAANKQRAAAETWTCVVTQAIRASPCCKGLPFLTRKANDMNNVVYLHTIARQRRASRGASQDREADAGRARRVFFQEGFSVSSIATIQQQASSTELAVRTALKSSLYPGASDQSVDMVLAYRRAAGLDPMQKPVHIVPMWDSKVREMRDVVMLVSGCIARLQRVAVALACPNRSSARTWRSLSAAFGSPIRNGAASPSSDDCRPVRSSSLSARNCGSKTTRLRAATKSCSRAQRNVEAQAVWTACEMCRSPSIAQGISGSRRCADSRRNGRQGV